MSRYELLHKELVEIRKKQLTWLLSPSLTVGIIISIVIENTCGTSISIIIGVASAFVCAILVHYLEYSLFNTYTKLCDNGKVIAYKIQDLQKRVELKFSKYKERTKGEQFKKAYDLSGKTLHELEEALSVGMYREGREIFVTAFMKKGVAVRVTASIGTPHYCSPSDDARKWTCHYERLECDQIRQYHNHPTHNGKTKPSIADFNMCKSLNSLVRGVELRSFIIFWNAIREWKIIEYNNKGESWLYFEFDAAA
jgi:hypothetical protein